MSETERHITSFSSVSLNWSTNLLSICSEETQAIIMLLDRPKKWESKNAPGLEELLLLWPVLPREPTGPQLPIELALTFYTSAVAPYRAHQSGKKLEAIWGWEKENDLEMVRVRDGGRRGDRQAVWEVAWVSALWLAIHSLVWIGTWRDGGVDSFLRLDHQGLGRNVFWIWIAGWWKGSVER